MNLSISQELSPIKFCFFIKPELESLSRAIKLANSFWGGRYCPIFPLFEKFDQEFKKAFSKTQTEEEFYFNLIQNFNPDIIVLQEELNLEFVSLINSDRIIISFNDLEHNIDKLENKYGLTILEVLFEIISLKFEYKRNDNLKILISKNNNNDLLLDILFNIPLKSLTDLIEGHSIGKDFIRINDVEFKDYFEPNISNNLTYSEINKFRLYPYSSIGDYFQFVLICNPTDYLDLILLWNLLATGRSVFVYPISGYNSNDILNGIKIFYQTIRKTGLGPAILKGTNVTIDEFNQAVELINITLNEIYPYIIIPQQLWIPRFGNDIEIAQKDGILSSNFIFDYKYEQARGSDISINYDLIKLPFTAPRYGNRKTHKITSNFHYFDDLLKYPSVIDAVDKKDWTKLTHSFSSSDYRLSSGGLVILCHADKLEHHFFIPELTDYLKVFFRKKGLQFTVLPQSELTRQIFKNIDGILGINRFSSVGAIKVLEALENNNVISYEALVAQIKKNKPSRFSDDHLNFLSILIGNKIIELGFQLRCTTCHQTSFYTLSEFSIEIICKNCRILFSPHQHKPNETFKWSYRGIGPFSKNNKIDGLFSVFLTLNIFKYSILEGNEGLTAFMNFSLSGFGMEKEVDLMLQVLTKSITRNKIDLIFCECKTYKDFEIDDIDRMIFLGEIFPNSILAFSTLKSELSANEKILIQNLVTIFRKGTSKRPLNPVLILTSNELLPQDEFNVFSKFGVIHQSQDDILGHLCDRSCELYLGILNWRDFREQESNFKKHLIGDVLYSLLKKVNLR